MHDELFLLEDKKRIIKFYQEYLEPMNTNLFAYIKYIITVELLLHGTGIIGILSLKNNCYTATLVCLLIGIGIVLAHIMGCLAFFPYFSTFLHKQQKSKTNADILHQCVERNFYITLTLYVSVLVHLILYFYAAISFFTAYNS